MNSLTKLLEMKTAAHIFGKIPSFMRSFQMAQASVLCGFRIPFQLVYEGVQLPSPPF